MSARDPTDAELLQFLIGSFIRAGARAENEGRWQDAESLYRAWMLALPMDPRAKWCLSLLLLRNGEYEEGFRLYDARRDIPELGISGPARSLCGTYEGVKVAISTAPER